MEPSAAPDIHHVWVTEKNGMVAKYESDLALQEELFDKLVHELRSVNESNLRELKAVVPSKLYRDIISPMAEKSFNYDKREIEASHKKRIGLIEDKHTKALAQHEVLYREKLKAALVNKNQPAMKPGSLPILSESTDDRSDHVSVSENSKKRKASTPEEIHPKRLCVDTSVNQVRTPAPTPANEPAHSPRRTVTFDEVYQDGRAKHKDIIVEWPTGSRQWYILKCEQHGLRFTRNSVQGAAKHLNGNGHGRTDRNRDYAVRTLGYLVTGCDENLAKLNNQVAEEAYANGYKPPLPRLKKQRDSTTGPKNKKLGGRGLASRPSVPHAANQVPGPAQEMSSSAQKVTAKERRESGTPSARQKSSDSGDGITHPKDFHIYYGRWKDNGLGKERDRIYPVMILGWDSQNGSGLKDSDLDATGLLKKKAKPPNCYTYDSRKITGWAPGYEDGGPKVRFRKFPVMFFDESQTVGWFPARDLMKFPLDKRKAPAQPDHPFNAARRWIAEREGFKTWEDRETARTGAYHPSVSPLTPAESANAASHTDHAEDDDSDDWISESEAPSVNSAVTEKMMQELREKGGEIAGDEDYVASSHSDSDIDASLDCEIDDWNRSSPPAAKLDNTTNRPWAFYGLRNTENTNEPEASVDLTREVQEKDPAVSSTKGMDSARKLARQACSSATDSHPHITPVSAIAQSPKCNPQVPEDPDQSDKSRSYNQQPFNQASINDDNLAQIIAETLNFRNEVYNPTSRTSENRTFISPSIRHDPQKATPGPVEDVPVQLSSANAVAASQGQLGEKISPTTTSKIVNTEVPGASPTKDSTRNRLTRDDDLSRVGVNDALFSEHETHDSTKSTISATSEMNETARRSQEGASDAKSIDALPKGSVISSSFKPLVDAENAASAIGHVSGAAKPEPCPTDADFELSFYKNGDVSWERTKEQEDCVQLFHSADRKTVSTRQGPVAITINPMEMVGFSREKDTIPDSKGNTVFVLRHENGSSSRLIFDRSGGSKLGNGKIQARGFVKWLRTVKPDIACF